MSVDQSPSSSHRSGDRNAPPLTPKRTPTSTILPSPVFETPKNKHARFDESGGRTPRFAEEYSVFNATPGNLRGGQTPFPDFGPATPYSSTVAGRKRLLSTDGIPTGIAVRVNEFSPDSSLPLGPAESSKVLHPPSASDRPAGATDQLPGVVERSVKKPRRNTVAEEPQGQQTTTPPPSVRKGGRKLAPRLDTSAMQHDQDFDQQAHYMATAQPPGMGNFVTAQGGMFGYPLSAPASAPPYGGHGGHGGHRSYWDPDPSLGGMDIDFGANGGNVYQPPTPQHAPGQHMDWARANHMLQAQGGIAGHGDGHGPAGDDPSALAPQTAAPMLVTSSAEHPMFAASYPTPVDPFGISGNGIGVDPGLLFSRPQSASMDTASFNQSMRPPSSSDTAESQVSQTHSQGQANTKATGRGGLRRSASAKDATPRKPDRALASSPVKAYGRPGLSRSVSENRGKKAISRPSLPTLAPAPRPQSQLVNKAGVSANRPVISQPQRPSGRLSPSKNSHPHHHHRLSSLSSIAETSGPQMRTQAKFMIDANGRARVETTVVVVDEPSPSVRKRHSSYSVTSRQQWDSSEDDSSSTDDEPIIIPSRNTSFALQDPRKPTTMHPHHNPQRSVSERSTTSYTGFQGGPRDGGGDSDGETVVNDVTPTRRASLPGDAASELRKLRETRQRQSSASKHKQFPASGHYYPGHPATSPTTLSEASLPTPTTGSRRRSVRCVCSQVDASRNDLLIRCESCELYVHGQCVSITRRTMPSIYICAFCANTPNMRGPRPRVSGHNTSAAVGPQGSATSPLAHKSLKSFR
ncbi:hypothetical protein BT67DRAFT_103853 [Trichocladium antarcticum]|uniref:Zinc finger PHD-type domain-containing protein n=1 Tax=Trichocladium antarcticum TaxID=1450529 RepID=A0AAN6ZGA6_9PEZI|nr:hypothetical protein BT67DRAFT_103853 [Trichocladium antarcticum]